jgi:hypothetical protein
MNKIGKEHLVLVGCTSNWIDFFHPVCFKRKEGTFFFVIVDLQAVHGFGCSWSSVLDLDLDLEIAPNGERADNVLKVK